MYTKRVLKLLQLPFVVSLSNHDGNQPFDRLRANSLHGENQVRLLYYIKKMVGIGALCISSSVFAATFSATEAQTHPLEQNFDLTQSDQWSSLEIAEKQVSKSDTIPSLNSQQLLQQPKLLENALYSSIVLRNYAAIEKLLPLYQQNIQQDSHQADSVNLLLIRLGQAVLSEYQGDNKTAIRLYRQIIADYPNLSDVRLDLAKALMDDQQNEAAKDQLLRLRSEVLSAEHDKIIERYLNIINQRSTWDFYGGLGYSYDPNINNAPKNRHVAMNGGIWTFNDAESAHGVQYQAGATRDWNIKHNYYAHFSADVYGKHYWTNEDYNDFIARAELGVLYKNIRLQSEITPYYQKRLSGNESYNHEYGVGAKWAYWLKPQHKLTIAGEVGQEAYEKNNKLTGQTQGASFTWLFVPKAKQYWVLGMDYAHKDAKDASRAYTRTGVRASWTQDWAKGLSTSMAVDVSKRKYEAQDIFNIQREEYEYVGRVSLWNRQWHLLGITPRLTLSYRTVDGNHPVYEYNKANAFIQFNKRF